MNVCRVILLTFFLLASALSDGRAQTEGVRSAMEKHGVQFVGENHVALLTNGIEKFDDMLCAISQAKHYVHLEYFNFRNDSIGNALFKILGDKAKEGVQVRAIFDGFGNDSNNKPLRRRHLDSIRATGVDIREFDPMRFPYLQNALHRDHRKIVVVDGALAYSGGMNVADYYLHGLPKFGAWRDTHFRLEGPAVVYYEHIFAEMWATMTGERIDTLTGIRYQRPSDFKRLKPVITIDPAVVGVADRVPKKSPAVMRRAFATMIDSAKHKIQIVSPYFIPTKLVWRALKNAVKRGVRLELMLSVDGDVPLTPSIVAFRANQLRKLGAHIYYYKGAFHHSKIMMVDDKYCTIGSTNLEARSLCYDYEVNAFIFDKNTTRCLSDIFEADKAKCTLLDDSNRRQIITNKKLFVGRLFNILTFVM
ncbi:MAG: cardiolipin synthase [Bacteroidaceae bacterium]|nr:cardiolipin synthase [Bacteroidaceae bacterium]